jgi:3,4-dihydroxyphenylacetate 2,3-dioxygenase
MSGVIASVLTPHTPRMAVAETAPDFVRPLIAGSRELGEWIRGLEPDCLVLQTTHWVCTFNWYAAAQPVHEGLCVAEEAPDMIPGLPYRHPGHPAFARSLAEHASKQDIPFLLNTSEHYRWDYAAYVPMKYIDPDGTLPVVNLPTVIMADLDESFRVGWLVDETARARGERVVYIASSALSHALVRGPDRWPTDERRALDETFISKLEAGEFAALIEWLPAYARAGVAEMGGRVVAGFLGALTAMATQPCGARRFGAYAQSSGSGNLSIALSPALAGAGRVAVRPDTNNTGTPGP